MGSARPVLEPLEARVLLDAVREPYLQAVAADSVYVLLEADSADDATVEYALDLGSGPAATATTESVEATAGGNYVHNVKLTGLQAGTQYEYRAGHGATTSGEYTFVTAAEPGEGFRFAWLADPRSNVAVHDTIAGRIDGYDPAFSLYGGDLCVDSSWSSWDDEFFVPNQQALAARVPFFNAVGNHEGWNAMTRAFTHAPDAAGDANGYYAFDYGDLHVLVLNTEIDRGSGSDQWNFAAADLSASTARWKIVIYHKPAYSSNRQDADMQAMTAALFEPNGVDMVLCGHDHYYEHNLANGIHHMVIGTAGAPPYSPDGGYPYAVYAESTYCFAIFDMTPDTLSMTAYREDGSQIETVDLAKDATPPTVPTHLSAVGVSDSQVDLAWTAANDPESGIDHYNVYRHDGADYVLIGTSPTATYSDTGLGAATGYSYRVSAVNGAMGEGGQSAPAVGTTLADATGPALAAVTARGLTTVQVRFDEAVEATSAEAVGHYAITDPAGLPVPIAGAAREADEVTVTLDLAAALSADVAYRLAVADVEDLAGNAVAPGTAEDFVWATNPVLVPAGSGWRYLDDGSDQGTAWRERAFDDSGWAAGPAELGYGDGGEATVVGYGPSAGDKYITTYFRTTFLGGDPSRVATLALDLLRDDGAVVYLNGAEVLRSNMPGGAIGYRTPAAATVGGGDESTFFPYNIPTAALVSGTNVVAVEIHQRSGSSSDISFDLALTAAFAGLPPTAADDAYDTDEDTPLDVPAAAGVLDNDDDPDADPLSAVLVNGPSHGSVVLNGDGSFLYTPQADYWGADSFSYKAHDGSLYSGAATVTIGVEAVNDAPAAGDDVAGTAQDSPTTIDVLANDTDAEDDPLTITVLGSTHGAAAVNDSGTPLNPADDTVDFAPDAGFAGLAEITYRVNDGELDSNVATVSVTVGSHAAVPGTAGDDVFTFAAGGAVYVVGLNGQEWHYDAAFIQTVSFDGNGGNDLARLTGTAGSDAVVLRPGSARLTHDGKDVDFAFTDVEAVEAHTGGGGDTAELYGTAGNDRLRAYPDSAYMTGAGYRNEVIGFGQVRGYAGGGLDDRAYLYGSAGNDNFWGRRTYAKMSGPGYSHRADGFDRAYGYAKGGSNDRAYLYGSAGNDKFWGRCTYAKMAGAGYYNRANGFDRAYGYAKGGTDDRAYLYGSAAAESFWGKSTYGKMTGAGFYNLAKRFDRVYAYLNAAGTDVARVYGPSAADRFRGYGGWAKLFAADIRHYVRLNSPTDDTVHLYNAPGMRIDVTPPLSYQLRRHP